MAGQMLRMILRVGRRGAVASEFAIVGIAMLSVLFLAIEVIFAMVARGTVEAGLDRASRVAATGAPLPNPTMAQRWAQFDLTYSAIVGAVVDYPASITNTITSYMKVEWVMTEPTAGELAALGKTRDQVIRSDLGDTKWYVVYESVYQHPLLSGMLICGYLLPGCDGRLRMDFRIMRQNEPF